MKQVRMLLLLCALFCAQNSAYALFFMQSAPIQDSTKVLQKKVKKPGFFKRIFQHNDSAQRARRFINEHHKLLKKDEGIHFPMDMGSSAMEASFFETAADFKLGYEVFGWYPYWEKNYYKHLNFSLLSTVAYFSYEVDPATGNPKTTHEWETTKLIDSIKAHQNKRILLTVSNFGIRNNRRFLRNSKAVDQLITNLIPLLSKRKADGVCIDFEGVQKRDKDNYTSFLLDLSNRLKAENESYKIYLAIPSVDFAKSLDFKSLVKAVDRFVIMGYDYYGKTSKVAGPVAPMQSGKEWDPFNLENSINYYLNNNIPPAKLVLALPNYGSLWETENLNLQSKVKKYIGARTYSYIKSRIENKATTYIEPISKSAYSAYTQNQNGTTYRQLWFDNDSTFHYKINLIKKKKLAGVGIWALGYDKGYDDFWNVIHDELSAIPKNMPDKGGENGESGKNKGKNDPTSGGKGEQEIEQDSTASVPLMTRISNMLGLPDPESKINKTEEKLPSVADYKYVLLYTLSFLLIFGIVGFIGAILFTDTRAAFFSNRTLKIYYMTAVLTITIVVIRMFNWIGDHSVVLIVGFVLGGFAFYTANKLVELIKQNLP